MQVLIWLLVLVEKGVELGEHYLVNFTAQHGFIAPGKSEDGNGDEISPKNMSFAIGVGYRF